MRQRSFHEDLEFSELVDEGDYIDVADHAVLAVVEDVYALFLLLSHSGSGFLRTKTSPAAADFPDDILEIVPKRKVELFVATDPIDDILYVLIVRGFPV